MLHLARSSTYISILISTFLVLKRVFKIFSLCSMGLENSYMIGIYLVKALAPITETLKCLVQYAVQNTIDVFPTYLKFLVSMRSCHPTPYNRT